MTVHAEKRVIPHRPEELYALVADVRRYPEFLPWCMAARIREENDAALTADLIIGFQMFRERFTSYVELDQQNHPRGAVTRSALDESSLLIPKQGYDFSCCISSS